MKLRHGLRSIVGSWFWMGFALLGVVLPARGEFPLIFRMRRVSVNSEAIRTIGYHHKTKTLEIQFQSRETYRYALVPAFIYEELLAADSKGRYFQDRIRGHYAYWKVVTPHTRP